MKHHQVLKVTGERSGNRMLENLTPGAAPSFSQSKRLLPQSGYLPEDAKNDPTQLAKGIETPEKLVQNLTRKYGRPAIFCNPPFARGKRNDICSSLVCTRSPGKEWSEY